MMAGAVYTLPAQRSVPLPLTRQRLIPMATWGGKLRSFTLPRESNLHTLLTPPTKEEQQTRNGEFSKQHNMWMYTRRERERSKLLHRALYVGGRTLGNSRNKGSLTARQTPES